jgi:hypothetical protein
MIARAMIRSAISVSVDAKDDAAANRYPITVFPLLTALIISAGRDCGRSRRTHLGLKRVASRRAALSPKDAPA